MLAIRRRYWQFMLRMAIAARRSSQQVLQGLYAMMTILIATDIGNSTIGMT